MRAVWKFELPSSDPEPFTLRMPAGAQPLSVQEQAGVLCLWALVEPENEVVERRFLLVGTGWPLMQAQLGIIGTAQVGPFVWHLFDLGGPPEPKPKGETPNEEDEPAGLR